MKDNSPKTEAHDWAELGSFKSYLLGFVFSILLTVGAYFAVVRHVLSGKVLALIVAVLAILQMVIQFIFFLHLGKETKPRWNVMVFLFMLLIIVILVIGSLWIMYNLDYRMMPMEEMREGI